MIFTKLSNPQPFHIKMRQLWLPDCRSLAIAEMLLHVVRIGIMIGTANSSLILHL